MRTPDNAGQPELQLRKFVAPEFVFGVGARLLASRYAVNLGSSRILLVSDPGVQDAGWTEQIARHLSDSGFPVVTCIDVSPNPREKQVMSGAELFLREQCDAIVSVGGGSPMDCAKGIGIVVAEKRPILEFEGVDRISAPIPPLICIPTTSGSSADVSQFAIVTDCQAKRKVAIISKVIVPDISLIDPLTLTTLSPAVTVATGFDAITHAFEAYVSNAQSPMTDLLAFEALRLLFHYLPLAVREPTNLVYRAQVMLGSLDAGLAFSNASLGAVHAMAHAAGGLLDIAHGDCNSILLPHVIRYNFLAAPSRYAALAAAAGVDIRDSGSAQFPESAKLLEQLIEKVVDLQKTVHAPRRFRDYGMNESNIPRLAELALMDPCMVTNPRNPTSREIESIYESAL